MVECPTCHAPLPGTIGLRHHIRMNPDCMWKEIRSPKEIEKEILNEVRRQRDRMVYKRGSQKKKDASKEIYERDRQKKKDAMKRIYDRDRQMQRDRKKEIYDRDQQKERDRQKVIYDRDPQRQRDRKQIEYENQRDYQLLRKQVAFIATKETQDSTDDLRKFLDEGRYGPIFRGCS